MLESLESIVLGDESATERFGQHLAGNIKAPLIIFLQGELGAGKTTLIRGFLRGLQFTGRVKSPTYTLVEEYDFEKFRVYHFDLYRIDNPEELEFMGMREYFEKKAVLFVEWPEKGAGFLPTPDLLLILQMIPNGEGRSLTIQFFTKPGLSLKSALVKFSP